MISINPPIRGSIGSKPSPIAEGKTYQSPYKGFNRFRETMC